MNDLTRYEAARTSFRPGDILAFQGRGVLPSLITAFSAGPSHIAIVRSIDRNILSAVVVKMVESTIEGNRNGVQTNRVSERLADYQGRAWWLPLSEEVRKLIDWFKFYKFIGQSEDSVHYDTEGLFEFIWRGLPIIGPRIGQTEHRDQMVCSGFVTAVLENCGVLRGINWSKVSPQDLVEMKLYAPGLPVQLIGEPGSLSRYNSL